jgi:hypothetical protein
MRMQTEDGRIGSVVTEMKLVNREVDLVEDILLNKSLKL